MVAPDVGVLNRTVLARQSLLARAPVALPSALERIGGIQAQYAPSMYVGLWSRVEGFERSQLDAALDSRSVVQGTLMRATIHLVSAADYWPLAIATRQARRTWWLRSERGRGITAGEMEATAARAERLLADGPAEHAALEGAVGRTRMEGLHQFLDIVRVPPSGTWARRRANRYAAAVHWIGPEPSLGVEDAIDHAVRRYLQAFGPAAVADVARWAGLNVRPVRAACERLGVTGLDVRGGVIDLPEGRLTDATTTAPVRFLPTWDATLLTHIRRAGVVREDDRARIFTSANPQSLATFLVDGVVAGAWSFDGERIVVDPFRPLAPAARRAVAGEAARLAELHR